MLIGVEDKITEVGVVDSTNIEFGTSTMDTNNANTIVGIGLVNALDFVKGKSCGCWWEAMNSGDIKAGIVDDDEFHNNDIKSTPLVVTTHGQ